MRSTHDIEQIIQTKLHARAGAALHDRVLARVRRAQARDTETTVAHPSTRRRSIMKYASIAAIIGIAMLIGSQTITLSPPAYALDKTVAAMQNLPFIHMIKRQGTGGPIVEERWIEVGPDGQQVRYRHDRMAETFVIQDGASVARFHHEIKTVMLYSREQMPYRWVGALAQTFENLRDEGLIIEEYASFRGRLVHKVWWPTMRSICYVDPDTQRPVAIGSCELTYELPPKGTFDIARFTPRNYTVVDRRDETDALRPRTALRMSAEEADQENRFYVDVELIPQNPISVEILNGNDVIPFYRTGPRRYAGDLDLKVTCDCDISWALSITSHGIQGGDYACWVKPFHMSAPGGVVSVGAELTNTHDFETLNGGKLATVKLKPRPRPEPMHDARACQTLGLALYDAARYEEALAIFVKMEAADNADPEDRALAAIWQGHMLDLLGRRDDAIARYQAVVDMDLTRGVEQGQYGLHYDFAPYAQSRAETPFIRIENRDNY